MWRTVDGATLPRLAAIAVLLVTGVACSSVKPDADVAPRAPTPTPTAGDCGDFTIAFDPSKGYEASAFIVGTLAKDQLGCDVTYLRTNSRQAWRLVARGAADVYLDAYGDEDLRTKLVGPGRPVTLVGPNGVHGGVDMVVPAFMGTLGLDSASDLPDVQRIGWQAAAPAITTVPELIPLARAFIDFQQLGDYAARDFDATGPVHAMRRLFTQPARGDRVHRPAVYLLAGPLGLLGEGEGRHAVQIPESAASGCAPDARTTLCSLADFRYEKIVSRSFASSGSPAYSLVYHYRLTGEDVATIMELVVLSGYDVGSADAASWINTHPGSWRGWLDQPRQ